jgi:hypothetical protein
MRMAICCALAVSLFAASVASRAHVTTNDFKGGVSFDGRNASVARSDDGGFVLHSATGERHIPVAPLSTRTASPLFDALFALAQDDLARDSVSAITDGAFDHGQSIPCPCFETGEKWHYVWTRDLSYSVDLALWRLDPERAKASLRFKLSDVREPSAPQGLYVMQDTGSGGSWPISTDRIVWFLAARHLLNDPAFAGEVYRALNDTLTQDRLYTFDATLGLYRGETSFLDWRQQTYPMWAAKDVTFIGQSFALSTNVLHYEALRLAAEMSAGRSPSQAAIYEAQAKSLKDAINRHFWRSDRGMYMSYIGGADHPQPFDTYDLLGISLAITIGVADPERARQTLAHYPTWPAGSPVIWPERDDVPIYHNRAIWPFVSAYALRAARQVNDPARIAHELQSLMRGAALAGSNMENFELVTQSTHVDDGDKSGPVVDSPRQLWSVAAYLNMVVEGVFGLDAGGKVEPKLPISLVPMLFGDKDRIHLQLSDRDITLVRPKKLDGNLLISGTEKIDGKHVVVMLKSAQVTATPLRINAPLYAPDPSFRRRPESSDVTAGLSRKAERLSLDREHPSSKPLGSGLRRNDEIGRASRWQWTASSTGRFKLSADYINDNGTIETGVTAAVYLATASCDGAAAQTMVLVMPHSEGRQQSTYGMFDARAGQRCTFALKPGFNMSYLSHFAHYTGGKGGIDGPLNGADIGDLWITPMASGESK